MKGSHLKKRLPLLITIIFFFIPTITIDSIGNGIPICPHNIGQGDLPCMITEPETTYTIVEDIYVDTLISVGFDSTDFAAIIIAPYYKSYGGLPDNYAGVIIDGNGHKIVYNGSSLGNLYAIYADDVTGFTLKNITISGFTTGLYFYGYDDYGYNSTDNALLISDAYFVNDTYGVWVDYSYNPVAVVRSTFIGTGTGIGLYSYEAEYGLNIRDSYFNGYENNTYIEYHNYGTIINSTFTNATMWGIYIEHSYFTVYNSNITYNGHNGIGGGVYIEDTEMKLFFNNLVAYNEGPGVVLEDTSINMFNNYIHDNNGDGINGLWGNGYYRVSLYTNILARNNGSGIFINKTATSWGYLKLGFDSNIFRDNVEYGLEINGTVSSVKVYLNMYGNYFINNSLGQVYVNPDLNAQLISPGGTMDGNYYSDYSGSGSYQITPTLIDNNPLITKKPEIRILGTTATYNVSSNLLELNITIVNEGNEDASSFPLEIYYSLPPFFKQTQYNWIEITPGSYTAGSYVDYYDDYGNYTLTGDDEYFGYKLPFPINIYGNTFYNISATTNGYVELTNSTFDDDLILYNEYTYHFDLYEYYVQEYEISYLIYGVNPYFWNEAIIFAGDGDLDYRPDSPFNLGIFNLGNSAVMVYFNGTTNDNDGSTDYSYQYQIIFFDNGTLRITYGATNATSNGGFEGGDGFAGISYMFPYFHEFTLGYQMPPHTSWQIDDVRLHLLTTTTVTVPANSTVTVSLQIQATLPYSGDVIIWVKEGHVQNQISWYKDFLIGKRPLIFYGPPPPPPPPLVFLTHKQKEAINDTKKFFEKHEVKNQTELLDNWERIESLYNKLVDSGLASPVPEISEQQKIILKQQLESIYGPMLVNYPTPEGRIYLLYWLYK